MSSSNHFMTKWRWVMLATFCAFLGLPVNAQYRIRTVAGGGPPDGSPATAGALGLSSIATDQSGNVYIAAYTLNRVFRVTASGLVNTVAGIGTAGYSGDGGPASAAVLNRPSGVAVDAASNVYIADSANVRIRKVSPNGVITTVAGGGSSTADGIPATSADISAPYGITVDGAGHLYFTQPFDPRVRKVSPNGILTTVAGNGQSGDSGDGGPALAASLVSPIGVAVDSNGNVFISDQQTSRVRKVSTSGMITAVAGTSGSLLGPVGIAVDASGNLYIADQSHRVQKVSTNGVISTVAGNGIEGFSGDGGLATSSSLRYPSSVALDGSGNVYVADQGNGRLRKISTSGVITTVAGNGLSGNSGDGGAAIRAQIGSPSSVTVDSAGNYFIAANRQVRKVTPDGEITTVAGYGTFASTGDGGPATSASLLFPGGWRSTGRATSTSLTNAFGRCQRTV